MAESDKQQFGDGGDQWGEAARNLANAAKELGKEGAKTAAVGTAAGAANSSAALVSWGGRRQGHFRDCRGHRRRRALGRCLIRRLVVAAHVV